MGLTSLSEGVTEGGLSGAATGVGVREKLRYGEKTVCIPETAWPRDDVPSGAIDGKYGAVFDFVNR